MTVHSWHHHTRWPESHPFVERKRRERRRQDDLRAAFGICLGAVIGSGVTTFVVVLAMVVLR